MLASMASSPTPVPLREQSRLSLQQATADISGSLNLEDRICPGCKKSAMSEQGSLVVAFGQSFFHVACFKCAKCGNQVTADTNLLLLSDGSPICADCSYNCNICHLPILDEAIMTGDDSYHAHCFKCKVCKNRIDELIFAKTSQGIYCMQCHNARMIKIRKYTQKKAERERNSGGSSRSRDGEARHRYDNGGHNSSSRPSSGSNGNFSVTTQQDTSRPSTARSTDGPTYARPAVKPKGPPQPHNGRAPQYTSSPQSNDAFTVTQLGSTSTLTPSSPSPNPAVTVAPPPENERPNPAKSSTLPVPAPGPDADPDGRRRSYDDGVRPLQILFGQKQTPDGETLRPDTSPTYSESLTITPRQERRRSINPGLKLPNFSAALPSGIINTSLSPASAASPDFRAPHSPTSPGGRDSLQGQERASRPTSQTSQTSQSSSVRSYHSFMTPTDRDTTRSRTPSMTTLDHEDHTVVLKPSQSHSSRGTSRSPSPVIIQSVGDQRHLNGNRLSSTSNLSAEGRGSTVSSRSNSPYHLVDVPRGIEDGSDSDGGGEAASPHQSQRYSSPPELPPKSDEEYLEIQSPNTTEDADVSGLSQYDVSDDMSESSPVERTSRTTFIAPALPPIRISLDSTGFSKLLDSVQGSSALKSLDQIATFLQGDDSYGSPVKPTHETTSSAVVTSPPTSVDVQQPQDPQTTPRIPPPEERATIPLEIKKISREDKPLPAPGLSPKTSEGTLTNIEVADPSNVIQVTPPDPGPSEMKPRDSTPDAIITRLREILRDSQKRDARPVQLDVEFLEAVVVTMDSKKVAFDELKEKFDGIKRTSKNFIDGVLVAQAEYDKEQKARRDAEAEVTRLRVLLSGQAAKLTAMSSEDRRHEVRQQISKELNDSLSGLEHDLSRLKLERDITLAEVEELSSSKTSTAPEKPAVNLSRSITKRLDTLKKQYQRDLIPLTEQRETLSREIAELRAIRDMFLEETTALNARNEELAQLSHIYTRRLESIPETPLKHGQVNTALIPRSSSEKLKTPPNHVPNHSAPALAPSLSASTSGSSGHTAHDDRHTPRRIKWMGSHKAKTVTPSTQEPNHKMHMEHNFQQLSILRFTRCDHCGDKLWGSQLRCTICSVSIHIRCAGGIQLPCAQHAREDTQFMPSMFGRDLIEQVQNDSQGNDRQVPIIVEKCIQAVEATALEYEGIYRKNGGSSQSKMITQLFERGDYTSFDLLDTDRFNDICSVTSVLKNYFRALPNPLLTFQFYDQFVQAISIKDITLKNKTLSDLVQQLPSEHYHTLRVLMIHLGRINDRNEKNLMNARNLGVVFGPTLIKSPDPAAEFGDMAQRALFVEWLVQNASKLFNGET